MLKSWNTSNIPSLDNKVAIITGGNIGLGYKSSLELARKGARIVIACRSEEKGRHAIEAIKREVDEAQCDVIPLDLLDYASIERFSTIFKQRYEHLDILLNNAGVVNLDRLHRSSSGNEMHMATNHLGHFALTGCLFERLVATKQSRVVTVSSLAYKAGVINFDDFAWQKRKYDRIKSYGASKLANLLFMYKLQEKFKQVGSDAISVAAHPGLTGTERQQSIGIGGAITRWIASPVSKGCLHQLLAATEPNVTAREFYGPRFGIVGPPQKQTIKPSARDVALADSLWDYSEEQTNVYF